MLLVTFSSHQTDEALLSNSVDQNSEEVLNEDLPNSTQHTVSKMIIIQYLNEIADTPFIPIKIFFLQNTQVRF